MASVRFYIEKRRDDQGKALTRNRPVLLYFSFDGKRVQLNTGEKVDAGDWDAGKQIVRPDRKGASQINRYLKSLSEEILQIYGEARSLGIRPGKEYIRNELKLRSRRSLIDFFDVMMRFIDENHNDWSIHTFRKMRTTYNHLRNFADSEDMEINFNRIDGKFLDRYAKFFRIKYKHSNNTISKNIEVLKWFLNWATRKGYNKNLAYRDYQIEGEVRPKMKTDDLVLDWDELMKLNDYEPPRRTLRAVKDIFLFMCFSGVKLSRISEIKTTLVFEDHIRLPGRDGVDIVSFPVNKRASSILAGYAENPSPGGRCFPLYDHSYFNRLLKKLGMEAGINSNVSLEVVSGSLSGTRQVPKYEVMSSKMAVNTFIYNGLRLGISAETLAYITDQKTYTGIDRFRTLLEGSAFRDVSRFDDLYS